MSAVSHLTSQGSGPLTITPLQPTIGAEIGGIDLRVPLSDALRDHIKPTILK